MNENERLLFGVEGSPQGLALNTLYGIADNPKKMVNRRRNNGPIDLHHVLPS